MKEKILISIFFVAVFINYLGPIIDPDFPFHLKTGEYIYLHKEIPKDDPFSFYGEGIMTNRERFTLSQYWFAQIIFYKLYSLFGPSGIILLRAVLFSTFILLLWTTLKKRGFYSALILGILIAILLQASKLDRPQYYSFLFCLVLILLFEKYREKPDSKTPLYFVPPLMLLWANMHAGFVLGIAVILIYSFSETIKFFIKKPKYIGQSLQKKAILLFLFIALLAVLFSYINPITNIQLLTTLESHTDARWLYKENREYMSPIAEMGVYYAAGISAVTFFILFGFVNIIVALNIFRTKSIDLTNIALIVFSSVAAFTAVRYIPFFAAIAIPMSKDYRFFIDIELSRRFKKSAIISGIFISVFIFVIIYGLKDWSNIFKFGPSIVYPEQAADFLLKNRIGARMFNQHNRGSYLIWRLYPYYKVFNDTRYISLEAVIDGNVISNALDDYKQPNNLAFANALSDITPKELGRIDISSEDYHNKLKNGKPLWEKLLSGYNIDLIVHEACSDYKKELFPLTLRLLKDDEWVLIYLDGTMQIFVRNKEKYSDIIKKYKLPKEFIYDEIILETLPLVVNRVPISTPYSSLGLAYLMKGRDEDAKRMIKAALELDNNDLTANFSNAYLALKQNDSNNMQRLMHSTK